MFGDRVGIQPDIFLSQCLPTASLDWRAWQDKGKILHDLPAHMSGVFYVTGNLYGFLWHKGVISLLIQEILTGEKFER